MDDADLAAPNIENMIADGMAKARRELERSLPAIGICHYCESILGAGRIFCPDGCSEDWHKLQAAKKRNGQ